MVFAVLETEPRITSGTADAETLCTAGGERKYPLKSHLIIMTILSCKTVVPAAEVPEKQ